MGYFIQKAIDEKDMTAKALEQMSRQTRVMQPKYDGCHMVVVLTPSDETTRVDYFTGDSKPVKSCAHIRDALLATFGSPTVTTAYCGEVWKYDTAFAQISGAFRRHTAQTDLLFVPYDCLYIDGCYPVGLPALGDPAPYMERVARLRAPDYAPGLVKCPTFPCNDPYEYARQLKNTGGYDGCITRDADAPYTPGRCRAAEVVKVKPLVSVDVECVGVDRATGEKTGRATVALQVRLRGGLIGKVATGLDHHQQANPEQFIGKIVQVDAMDWTADGFLREPRFVRVRDDKEQPDY